MDLLFQFLALVETPDDKTFPHHLEFLRVFLCEDHINEGLFVIDTHDEEFDFLFEELEEMVDEGLGAFREFPVLLVEVVQRVFERECSGNVLSRVLLFL